MFFKKEIMQLTNITITDGLQPSVLCEEQSNLRKHNSFSIGQLRFSFPLIKVYLSSDACCNTLSCREP